MSKQNTGFRLILKSLFAGSVLVFVVSGFSASATVPIQNHINCNESYKVSIQAAKDANKWHHPVLKKVYDVKVDNLTGTVTLKEESKTIFSISTDQDTLPQAKLAVEAAKDELLVHMNKGGSMSDLRPLLAADQSQWNTGSNVLMMLSAISNTLESPSLEDQHQHAYVVTNKLRAAYGLDALAMPPMPLRPKVVKNAPIPTESKILGKNITGMTLQAAKQMLPNPIKQGLFVLKGTGKLLSGMASWYGPGFHGRKCANGERFDMNGLTAASRSLPFGTMIKVTNQRNGKAVVVRITDRGPFAHGRILDDSKGAAEKIGLTSSGVAPVVIEVLSKAAKKVLTQ